MNDCPGRSTTRQNVRTQNMRRHFAELRGGPLPRCPLCNMFVSNPIMHKTTKLCKILQVKREKEEAVKQKKYYTNSSKSRDYNREAYH